MASIYKHRNSWRVEIRRSGHKKISQSFNTKGKAETWARYIEQKIDEGVYVDAELANNTLFACVIDSYMLHAASMKRGRESESYRCAEFKEYFINYKIGSIKASGIATYRDTLKARGLEASTIKRMFTTLSAVFEYAKSEMDMKSLDVPTRSVKLERVEDRRERIFVDDEEERFFESASLYGKGMLVPVCRFAIETTMRRGEIVGIDEHVDHTTTRRHDGLLWNMVHISESILKLPKSITKNGKPRAVPLSTDAIDILLTMKKLRNNDNDKVFNTTPDSIRNAFRRACKKACIHDFHFHDLRHVGITKWSKVLPLLQLMRVSGHLDPRSLARYYNQEASEVAELMRDV